MVRAGFPCWKARVPYIYNCCKTSRSVDAIATFWVTQLCKLLQNVSFSGCDCNILGHSLARKEKRVKESKREYYSFCAQRARGKKNKQLVFIEKYIYIRLAPERRSRARHRQEPERDALTPTPSPTVSRQNPFPFWCSYTCVWCLSRFSMRN